MIVLDTDALSLLMRNPPAARSLIDRLGAVPIEEVATTIISFEEQVRGWMSRIARSRSGAEEVDSYLRLHRLLDDYGRLIVLDYDEEASAQFRRLRQSRLRVGTMDLRIAAIALARDATLVTRDLADFGKIPGLRAEDWAAQPDQPC
ncbi:type II toxin-antitoxin system VapC family toxin [Tautonia plasticadhaerens]|uniref:Ribonuclease VapC1 n=1 Tax=Tautonia plasticadhaerens TaxID=2527974 RepID=A0A518H2L9_9BACT|nr:type II toxin-antitoxin system VapC family toxin [Tautonia plasticadhaerens]QDV35088.1 Ribonuclease VapC1 [Tautonia plasticadhaerens]